MGLSLFFAAVVGGGIDGFADEEVEENWEAEELTVPELRAALAKRRLPTQGRKMDLGTTSAWPMRWAVVMP